MPIPVISRMSDIGVSCCCGGLAPSLKLTRVGTRGCASSAPWQDTWGRGLQGTRSNPGSVLGLACQTSCMSGPSGAPWACLSPNPSQWELVNGSGSRLGFAVGTLSKSTGMKQGPERNPWCMWEVPLVWPAWLAWLGSIAAHPLFQGDWQLSRVQRRGARESRRQPASGGLWKAKAPLGWRRPHHGPSWSNPCSLLPGAAGADAHGHHGREAPGPAAERPDLRPDGLRQRECLCSPEPCLACVRLQLILGACVCVSVCVCASMHM